MIYFLVLIKFINAYTLFILFASLLIFYNLNKKLFKRLVYKIIFKSKKNNLIFKNKYNAAKVSLESINDINNKINDKIKSELINYEKNKLESQLKSGDYKVILFGASSSGKTSIARSLLKSIIGKISPTLGTTKKITSYTIMIPILKRKINLN